MISEKETEEIKQATAKVNSKELDISSAKELTKKYSKSHKAFCILASVYLQNNDFEKCLDSINTSFKYGSSSVAFNLSGLAKANMNLNDDAKKDYLSSLKLNATDLSTLVNYANLLRDMKELEERISVLKKILLTNPNDLNLKLSLVRGYHANGDFENAIKTLESFIKETPDESLLYYYLGVSLCGLDKFEEGKTSFNTAIEKSDKPEELKINIEKIIALD